MASIWFIGKEGHIYIINKKILFPVFTHIRTKEKMADMTRVYSNELEVIRKERESNVIDEIDCEVTSGLLIEVSRSCCCTPGIGWSV